MGAPPAMNARMIITSGTVSKAPPVWPDRPLARSSPYEAARCLTALIPRRRTDPRRREPK